MRKTKKYLALTMAGAMLMSQSSVFAASTPVVRGNGAAIGDSIIENDNSTKPEVKDVVLPTLVDSNYDFTVDRQGLLAEYDTSGTYDGSTVYFKRVGEVANVAYLDSEGNPYQLYEKSVIEVGAGDMLYVYGTDTALFSGVVRGSLSSVSTSDYKVWVPDIAAGKTTNDSTNKGTGAWVTIDGSNIEDYFVIDWDEKDNTDPSDDTVADIHVPDDFRAGANAYNGKVYVETYVEISNEDAANQDGNLGTVYVTPNDPNDPKDKTIKTITTPLYADKNGDGAVEYTVLKDDLTYTHATTVYAGQSNEATIINKSTNPVLVKATVTLTSTNGLEFLTEDQTADTMKTAVDSDGNIAFTAGVRDAASAYAPSDTPDGIPDVCGAWFSIVGGENSVNATNSVSKKIAIGATPREVFVAEGVATMIIGAADNATTKIQAASKVTTTGSHNYYEYFDPITSFKSGSFAINGMVDTDPLADDLWVDYVAKLTDGTYSKPQIAIVYEVEQAEAVTDIDGNVLRYQVYNKATQEKVDALEVQVDDAKAAVATKQADYDTALKDYLAKEKANKDAEDALAVAEAAYDRALAELDAWIAEQAVKKYEEYLAAEAAAAGSGLAGYSDIATAKATIKAEEIDTSGGNKEDYKNGTSPSHNTAWQAARTAYINASLAVINDLNGGGTITVVGTGKTAVNGESSYVVAPAATTGTYTGTYADLHDAKITLENANTALKEAKTVLNAAEAAVTAAKTGAIVYDNTDEISDGVLKTDNDFWDFTE